MGEGSHGLSPSDTSEMKKGYLVWTLIVFAVLYRVAASQFPELSNTSPTMALCFGGGLLLGRGFWWMPALMIVCSDLLIGWLSGGGGVGSYTLLTAGLFVGAAFVGSLFSGVTRFRWPLLWCGVLLSSVIFYVAGNTYAWAVFPGYEPSLAGWWQSQTTGLPQFEPPAWVFLRNALIADSIWCALAGLVFLLWGSREAQRASHAHLVSHPRR